MGATNTVLLGSALRTLLADCHATDTASMAVGVARRARAPPRARRKEQAAMADGQAGLGWARLS